MSETMTAPLQGAAKKKAQPRKRTLSLDDAATVLQQPSEAIVSPFDILTKTAPTPGPGRTAAEIDSEYNIIEKDNPEPEDANSYSQQRPIILEPVEVPKIRKVAIKKISRFEFRMGLEKAPEKYKVMPGCSHRWMCDKRGNEFITGLDDKPQIKARLEKQLRINLSNTSDYYATLNFSLEDKEHGQIMNFDDVQMGPYYEVVYYAMLESSLIANGYQEYKSGVKPFAEWYIENKEAEAEAKQLDMTYDIEAMETFSTVSLDRRHGIAKLLALPVWGITDRAASVELWDHIKKDSKNAQEFLKIARMRSDELNVSILVKNAIKYNVIRRNRINDLVYANEVLGPTEEHVVSKLVTPTNASLRIAITRAVEGKNV